MAHHSSEIPDEIKNLFRKVNQGDVEDLRKQLEQLKQPYTGQPGFGATGKHPQGYYCPEDEGEIAFGVAADTENGKVIINFGKPTAWIGMDKEQALLLANTLRKKAMEL